MTTDVKKQYQANIKLYQPKPNYGKNAVRAFLIGGFICLLGEAISDLYLMWFPLSERTVTAPMMATMILLAALFTGVGLYDKLGQFGGAGALVPVTGFTNAMASAALEHRSEGLVHGVATNMFKMVGAVIVFGVVASYLVGLTRLLVQMLIS
ncbi:stage V sporulation protein AC [Halalkalibacterium halodurans]|jgi:stage V sporulation protein AC|uniref:stage V sporulation protein AC n=1 Tax=Halalkalibacterium halodurans TaxID=86665 RepID=UPI00106762CD|nr:stage V sporulation protein AC [Halalkalibacterium halodurans]MDY7222060.1 stage V sporulation protein AC [Halalkalibacterium halodurans]MDY7241336.1 stage V sporulation protein AC [Halalkalibacterium halodurans]MED3648511.1 stage V sporulation protein AC [Halalkalibacterium halodurans]MED4083075.1 stage V sporulation protein AC [Halalkalibacterium halodurans]MED4087096.1 stage V sporulation protein AC [Halalkalibacterium halodurans]